MSVETLIPTIDSPTENFNFTAADITGTRSSVASVPPTLPTHSVIETLVAEMSLPQNVPFGLREESTGMFLDDAKPIGEQIGPDAKVTITPKTHLG
jgi:hypothetical protein